MMMLRTIVLSAAAAWFAFPASAEHATLRAGGVAVVVAPGAPPSVQFAAKEMSVLLGQVLGCEIPVRHDFADGGTSIVLGTNAWSEAAGLSVDGLPRDAFRVKAGESRLYIAGADDPAADIGSLVAANNHWALASCEHATLYGVYDFLERFAGCGFYFPGEIGTVTPRADEVRVPVGDYERAPAFTVRDIYIGQKFDWPGAITPSSNYALNWLRLRLQTENIPCTHGSRNFRYIERFAKTHPEYLALKKDGSRWDDPKVFAPYQLCWSDPGLRETLYQDVKAYLTGQPAASRGLERWGVNCVRGKYVDIMPDDSFQGCFCPRCQAAYDFSGPKNGYATKLLWGLAAEIGNRLIAEGVPGDITMMAYTPYRALPDFALPTNVQVMVAENGPWSIPDEGRVRTEADEIARWAEKIGHKVWIWTYPRRGEAVRLAGIPSMAPRAHAAYFKRVAKDIFGSFVESESERFVYHYLNYWMFAKVAWDTDLDVDKALDGHYAKMFGAAAPEMKRFYEELEAKWMQMVGNTVDTPLGPVAKAPPVHDVYTRLYSPAVLAEWRKLFDVAEGKAAADAGSLRRVRFMRAQLLDELDRAVSAYDEATSAAKNLARREGRPNRSVVRGGEFDSLDGWEAEAGTVSATLDHATFVTPPASVKLVSDKRAGLRIRIPGVLKPNAKYRVSFFLKTENVSPTGGAFVEFGLCKKWLYFPEYGKVPPSGTVDWLYQSYEFTAPPGADADPEAYFHLLLTSAGTAWYDGLRVEEVETGVTFAPGRSEVVVAPDAPMTVRFAACEATNFLSRVLGAPVPVVEAPSGNGVASLVLGENEWSRAAGVAFDQEKRDAFAIAAQGDRVYVVGRDDPRADPFRIVRTGSYWQVRFERATLFGVYEFFERYAGCRFFFPGEFGTILPRADAVVVPEGTLRRAPYFTSRNPYMGGDGLWHEDHASPKALCPGKALDWMRLRLETENAPCCHGSRNFRYIERFAKTHPEYLALKKDGSRWDDPDVFAAYQLCWTDPGLRETMYQDVKAYLTGQDAASRGLKRWGVNCVGGKYVDIMPEDSFQGCWCARCQAAYDRTKKHYADGLIWGFTVDLARRLKAEAVAGTVTQMAYMPYGDVPEFDLPDNVLVIVAQPGPWSFAKAGKVDEEVAHFRAWQEKTGRRVQTWTYPHKFGPTAIAGVPHVAPRAFGAYWKRAAPYVCGGFLESESERAIYNYLNYYVFAKVAWDPALDAEAPLDDHNRKMFGGGADEMDAFFRLLEEKWIHGIVGNVAVTALGPVARVPAAYDLWARVYAPEVLRRLAGHCDRAAAAAGEGTDAARRVAFVRDQFLGPLEAESRRYLDLVSVAGEQARRRAAGAVASLVPEADFSEDNGRGGCLRWSSLARDAGTFVSAPSAGRLSGTNRIYAIRYFRDGELKPATRYRVSYYLKLADVRKRGAAASGVHMAFSDGMTETRFPAGSALDGTIDWIHQSFEVTTGADAEKLKKGLVCLRLMDASGTVWLDDVQITEIRQGEEENRK